MMIQIGNDKLVGFHLGPPTHSHLYDCKIFIGGECVSDCQQEYLPDLASNFRSEIERYRKTLNFLRCEDDFLAFDDITQIHNALVQTKDGPIEELKWRCFFLNWQMPLTDVYQSFLIPFRGQLWLTWQKWVDHESQFPKLDIVPGIQICPYDIIDNFRDCLRELENAG